MSAFGDLLENVSESTTDALGASRRTVRFHAGEELAAAGRTPGYLYLIGSGRLRVWRPTASGRGITLYYLGPGDAPGLVAACRGVPMPSTMTAMTPLEAEA